jgi:glycosyltransferase involved in cell wall biosynthesis
MSAFTGKVVLLANYPPDQQESMRRFAQMMQMGLQARGVAVDVIRPEQKFGGETAPGGLGKWLGYVDKFLVFPRRLKRRLRQMEARDVLHICDHANAVYTKYATRTPHVVTCHDLLAIRSALGEIPENPTGATGRIYQRMILDGLNRARRVVCVSKATRDDLRRLGAIEDRRVSVIENGLNHSYGVIGRAEALQRIGRKMKAPPHFILHVGGNQWYKNRSGVIGIYAEFLRMLPEGPDLILAGKKLPESLERQIEAEKISERVHVLTDCDNEDLRALYSAAEALLFPSLLEGFGWPIIEAQACGCPVITSAVTPMNDVGGDAAVYIDPRDWTRTARTLRDLLWEPGLDRAIRKQKGLANLARFGADRMIERYLEQYTLVASA